MYICINPRWMMHNRWLEFKKPKKKHIVLVFIFCVQNWWFVPMTNKMREIARIWFTTNCINKAICVQNEELSKWNRRECLSQLYNCRILYIRFAASGSFYERYKVYYRHIIVIFFNTFFSLVWFCFSNCDLKNDFWNQTKTMSDWINWRFLLCFKAAEHLELNWRTRTMSKKLPIHAHVNANQRKTVSQIQIRKNNLKQLWSRCKYKTKNK